MTDDRTGPTPEHVLPGGHVNAVLRVGDTVRRPRPARAQYVRGVLRHLEQQGWPGAPRYLGTDERGREVLSFVDGHVAWQVQQPADVSSVPSLIGLAELVRQFHDLTAGTPWSGTEEVVCHNDLSPKNTVYRDLGGGLRPVAFIDWDLAAPGPRINDVAHVCWQYAGLSPRTADPGEAAHNVRVIADAYGLRDRGRLVQTVLWWQDRCRRGIEAAADAGDPAMVRLRAAGVVRDVAAAYRWTSAHRQVLEKALA
jgi:hypothetical protein